MKAKSIFLRCAAGLAVLWVSLVGVLAYEMRQPPERFGRFMMHMPVATFLVAPFESLWLHARAGTLNVGDAAPDFRLRTLDHSSEVELASMRGKPVVLVFGSYT